MVCLLTGLPPGVPSDTIQPFQIGGIMTTTTTSAQREPALAGQTVVVIGGSAGIGLETARAARAEGAGVVLTARNPERLRHAAHSTSISR
jgi:threonine dehydrogenase-like Zn-dependent dehydrogenase